MYLSTHWLTCKYLASSKDLDAARQSFHSRVHSHAIVDGFTIMQLWDSYGYVGYVDVSYYF